MCTCFDLSLFCKFEKDNCIGEFILTFSKVMLLVPLSICLKFHQVPLFTVFSWPCYPIMRVKIAMQIWVKLQYGDTLLPWHMFALHECWQFKVIFCKSIGFNGCKCYLTVKHLVLYWIFYQTFMYSFATYFNDIIFSLSKIYMALYFNGYKYNYPLYIDILPINIMRAIYQSS